MSAIAVGIAVTPANIDPHVAAIGPAQFLQALQERPRRACACLSSAAKLMITPMRRIRSPRCARAASGHAAAAPPSSVINSRRFIFAVIRSPRQRAPDGKRRSLSGQARQPRRADAQGMIVKRKLRYVIKKERNGAGEITLGLYPAAKR